MSAYSMTRRFSRACLFGLCLIGSSLAAQDSYIAADDPAVADFLDDLAEVAAARELERAGEYEAAAPDLRRLAEAGNPWAQNLLGVLHSSPEDGDVFPDDWDVAMDWYERAAAQDFPLALHNMARDLRDGYGDTPPDVAGAIALFERAAARGYADSMGELAIIFSGRAESNAAFADPDREAEMADAAYALRPQDPWVQTILADTYYFGSGRPVGMAAAFALYEAAAEQGDAYAQTRAGIQLLYGEGVKQDPARARAYLEVAAAQDYDFAFGYLAEVTYYTYEGVEPDYEAALAAAQRAVDTGSDWHGYILGALLAHTDGIEHDFEAARAAYELAYADGHPDAANALAYMEYFGQGGPVDLEGSYARLEAASEAAPDDDVLRYNIAIRTLRGHGTTQDTAAALAIVEDIYAQEDWLERDAMSLLAIILGHPNYAPEFSDPVRARAYCLHLTAMDEVAPDPDDPDTPNNLLPETCALLETALSAEDEAAAQALSETL